MPPAGDAFWTIGHNQGLKAFADDYPEASLTLLYGGKWEEWHGKVHCVPVEQALPNLKDLIGPPSSS